MKTYRQKLLDPRWQRKRLETLQKAEFRCEACGDAESTLHAHHKRYIKGRDPWEYEERDLVALCENCHSGAHADRSTLERVLSAVDPMVFSDGQLAALLAGYLTAASPFNVDLDDDGVQFAILVFEEEFFAGQLAAKALDDPRVRAMASSAQPVGADSRGGVHAD